MHELSRMDDETGDPLPGDRRLAPIPVGFTVRSGGDPMAVREQRPHHKSGRTLEIRLSCFKSPRNHVPLWRYLKKGVAR